MRMADEKLEKLGTYYCHFDISKRFGIPFWKFLEIVKTGKWTEYVGS